MSVSAGHHLLGVSGASLVGEWRGVLAAGGGRLGGARGGMSSAGARLAAAGQDSRRHTHPAHPGVSRTVVRLLCID